jgi:hypothetical protein
MGKGMRIWLYSIFMSSKEYFLNLAEEGTFSYRAVPDLRDRMKYHQQPGLFRKIIHYWCAAAIACGGSGLAACAAEPPAEREDSYWVTIENITYQWPVTDSIDPIWVMVEDITYQGDDHYKIDMHIWNRSQLPVIVNDYSGIFHVQQEAAGDWVELGVRHFGGDGVEGDTVIPPREGYKIVYIFEIPLDIPTLFKNNDGDINMEFKYQVRLVPGGQGVLRVIDDKRYYWINPQTDKWILREGM